MSVENQIQVYEKNDLRVVVNVTGITSLSGYTPTFTVKETLDSSTEIFSVTGSVSNLEITFTITAALNDIDYGKYYYEVTIENVSNKYTLAQNVYRVKKSLVYHVTGT